MFPTPSTCNKYIPDVALEEFDEKLNQLYFGEKLEVINYSNYPAVNFSEKIEFFGEIARKSLQSYCSLHDQLAHGLAVRLGMNFRYIIRALSRENIVTLCSSITQIAKKYFERHRRSIEFRAMDRKSEKYRQQIFNDILRDLSLNGSDRALGVLKKFEEYHQSFTFGCPNTTSIDKLSAYFRTVLTKQKEGPDCINVLLTTLDNIVFDGVVYSIKHVTGCARSALIQGLFKSNNPSGSELSPLTGVNFTTTWFNKLSRTHQGCKTHFRRDLMTSTRLVLHETMLLGLQKVPGEEADAMKALIKGASSIPFDKVAMPTKSDPVRVLAMKQYDRARQLVDIGGTATLEDAELVALEIMMLPPVILDQLKRQSTRFFVCRDNVTEVLPELKGVIPRGYTNGLTWDSVLGCNDSVKNIVVVATTIGPDGKRWVPPKGFSHGCQNICIHELAHAFDLNESQDYKRPFNYNNQPSFVIARNADLPKLPAYLLQPDSAGLQETFAESASRYFGGDPSLATDWPNLYNFWYATDHLWREKYPEGWFGKHF